jgi:GAF domain-containing protein/HAMP domain-containing protein
VNQRPLLRRIFDFSNWPLWVKNLFGLLIAALVPLLLYAVAGGIGRYIGDLEEVRVNLQSSAEIAREAIDLNLQSALTEVYNNSQDLRFSAQIAFHARALNEDPNYGGAAALTSRTLSVMEEQFPRHPLYQAIRLVTPDGRLLAQYGNTELTPSLRQQDHTTHPAYMILAEQDLPQDNALLLPPYPDPETNRMLLEAVTLVVEEDTLLGYLIFTLDAPTLLAEPLTNAAQRAAALKDTLSEETLFILDEDNWLITPVFATQPFERQIMMPYTDALSDPPELVDSYERTWREDDTNQVTGRVARIESTGWTIVAEVPLDAITGPIISTLFVATLPILAVSLIITGILLFGFSRLTITPIVQLAQTTEQIATGDLEVAIPYGQRQDEIGQLSGAIGSLSDSVKASIQDLEARVQTRTRDLELATFIAREASTLESIDVLLDRVVNLIVENFNSVYHAQVFLIDDTREYANLVASTGEPGRQLLARQHRLAVGSVSVIGRVTELGQTVIARDTSSSRVHKRNEFLPDTRAEMALPLIRADYTLGALDVQSRSPAAFTEDEQAVFETLAAQLAVAIDNARRFVEINQLAQQTDQLNRQLTRADWQRSLLAARRSGKITASAGLIVEDDTRAEWSEWQHKAAAARELVISPPQDDGLCVMAIPIIARDELVGVVEWRIHPDQITENTRLMARELTDSLGVVIETIRLLERSERQAERERLVNAISGRLTTEPNIGLILEAAIEELSSVLNTQDVHIQLQQPTPESGPTENA